MFPGLHRIFKTVELKNASMKIWKVGQKVVCDRPNNQLTGCVVRSVDEEIIVIFCPGFNMVICGQFRSLKKLGWRTEEAQESLTQTLL